MTILEDSSIGVLPSDWSVETLGDLFVVAAGGDWDAKHSTRLRDAHHPYPVVANALAPGAVQGYCSYYTVCGDTLTITGRGDVGHAVYRDEPYVPIVRLLSLVPRRDLSSKFYADFINERVRFSLESTGVPQLTAPQIRSYVLPVPPPAEQHAISSVINDVDDLIATFENLITKKQAITQGVMQQLLTGRTRLPGFNDHWRDVSLGEVAQLSKGMGLPKSAIKAGGHLTCIHYGELFTHYGTEIDSVTSRTDDASLRVRSIGEDVLMPTSDVTPRGLAKASAVLHDGVVLGGDILIIRPDRRRVFGPFLARAIRRDADQVLQLVRGSTVYHLYASDMGTFSMALPSIDEQRAICDVLRDADDETAVLEERLAKARAIKVGMMQQLLTGRVRLPVEASA